jgi:hypothetical protein
VLSRGFEISEHNSPRLWPAHVAMVDGLADTDWHSQDVITELMLRSSRIQRKTCTNLIGDAVRSGAVLRERRGRHFYIKIAPC